MRVRGAVGWKKSPLKKKLFTEQRNVFSITKLLFFLRTVNAYVSSGHRWSVRGCVLCPIVSRGEYPFFFGGGGGSGSHPWQSKLHSSPNAVLASKRHLFFRSSHMSKIVRMIPSRIENVAQSFVLRTPTYDFTDV